MKGDILSSYDLDYCKGFSEDKLRKMYNGESEEVLAALIKAVKGENKHHKDVIEIPKIEVKTEVKPKLNGKK